MNTDKKFERCLRAAPKPSVPDGLLNKLTKDINLGEVKTKRSSLRRWFAPTGQSISPWRVAAAAAIAIAVLLPLSYGAVKVIKRFTIYRFTFEYPEDNTTYTTSSVIGGDNIHSEEDARKVLEEFGKLYREDKAEEVKPGIWVVTLSNGEKFAYAGDPELVGLPETEKKELLRKRFDEIHELKKAGKFEKTYKPEHDYEIDGIKYRYFEARYTLSDGTVKTLGDSEPVIEEDKHKD